MALNRLQFTHREVRRHVQGRRIEQRFPEEVLELHRRTEAEAVAIEPEAEADEIRENYRLLMALLHPDRLDRGQEDWPSDAAQRVNRAHGNGLFADVQVQETADLIDETMTDAVRRAFERGAAV